MAISTQQTLEMAVKHAHSIAHVMRAYANYNHRISKAERQVLYELVGVLTETKDLSINTIRAVDNSRWEE